MDKIQRLYDKLFLSDQKIELNTSKKLIKFGIIFLIFGIGGLIFLIKAMFERFDVLVLILSLIVIIFLTYAGYDLLRLGVGLKTKNLKIINEYNKRKPIMVYTGGG